MPAVTPVAHDRFDADWIVIGSGFGGSVAALRLAEKGHRVLVLEAGERFGDQDFPETAWNVRRTLWAPAIGLRGPTRVTLFKDIFVISGAGVGGGSLIYGNTLYRAGEAFYRHPQWRELADWQSLLFSHYHTAETMLGVQTVPWESGGQVLLRKVGERFGNAQSFRRTPCGVYFGEAGKTVADPYFGGSGPARTGCIRCGGCTLGCRVGAKNTLVKNYLWFAERRGVGILAGTEALDVVALDGADGAAGYAVRSRPSGRWIGGDRTLRARGVVFAAGAIGTNRLLARCRQAGLPRLSGCVGRLVRTNSESILAVTLPDDRLDVGYDVSISGSVYVSRDTHIEFVTYGPRGDFAKFFFTLLAGRGTRLTRPLRLLGQALAHPLRLLRSLWPLHWGRRTLIFLVMQSLDNAIAFVPRRRLLGSGVRLGTVQDASNPNPTYIEEGNAAAAWLARETGGLAQSMLGEALANIPSTAHLLGGAVVGASEETGVIDGQGRVFGYRNLLVCDGSALPANPGVNPSLTITALAEYFLSMVPPKEK